MEESDKTTFEVKGVKKTHGHTTDLLVHVVIHKCTCIAPNNNKDFNKYCGIGDGLSLLQALFSSSDNLFLQILNLMYQQLFHQVSIRNPFYPQIECVCACVWCVCACMHACMHACM